MRMILAAFLCVFPGLAPADRAGDFDYFVLSLSWQPTWCALEGDARGAPSCAHRGATGWSLHGLWPQYDTGWPDYCATEAVPPGRALSRSMTDIMGSAGLARHQWNKHGTCSGLSAGDYYALSRRAYAAVNRPPVLRALDEPVRLPARVVEDAFLEANQGWSRDMLTITCREGRIQEARLCLTKSLEPRPCGRDVRRDCTLDDALLDPVR